MWRAILAGLIGAWGLSAVADEPKPGPPKPPFERMLTGSDARQAEELESKIKKLQGANQAAEAAKLAQVLLDLQTRLQGDDHWQVRDARIWLDDLKRPLSTRESEQRAKARKFVAQAGALYGRGQYREAIAPTEAALRIRRELLGDKHPDTANSLNDLAFLYKSQREHEQAEGHYQDALRIRREVLGEKHPKTALSLYNLAALYQAQGAYAKAEPLYQEALQIRRDVLGERHPDTATSLNNLAFVYCQQSEFAKAEPLYQNALRIYREVLGEKHPDTANSLNNLAGLYSSQGAYAKAEPLFQDALQIYRDVLGKTHPKTALALNNLAALYSLQGAHSKAEPLHQESLRIRRSVLGEKHPDTANSLNNLAELYKSQGAYAKAEPLYLDALRIRRDALGEKHLDTATSLNNLATLYHAQGAYAKAEPLFLDALRIRVEVLGKNHPDTASSLNNVAGLYRSPEVYAKAEPLYQEALRINREVLGENHPATTNTLNNLAFLYAMQEEYRKAEPLFLDALRIRREVPGENHPDTAVSMNNLAKLYDSQEEFAKAERLHLDALRILRKVLGAKHPHTAASLQNLAAHYHSRGAYAQAEPILREAAAAFEAGRVIGAKGVDRTLASGTDSPYRLQAAGQAFLQKPQAAYESLEFDLARGLFDEQASRRGAELAPGERKQQAALAERLGVIGARVLILVTRPEPSQAEQQELDALLVERARLEAELTQLAAALSQGEIADLATIQGALTSESALVVWLDDQDRGGPRADHWGCVVRATGEPNWERLPGAGSAGKWTKSDSELPGKLRDALAVGRAPAAEIDDLSARLFAQRLAPLVKHLSGVSRLVVVPVYEMAGLPVEVLSREYTISYVPSGSLLAKLKGQAAPSGSRLLALGDPVFTRPAASAKSAAAALLTNRGGDWKELPGTRVELTQLARLFGKETSTLVDSAASEQSLEDLRKRGDLAKFRYLHFATHGEANNRRAFESALILAQDALPRDTLPRVGTPYLDGKLSAAEVLEHWQLDADLVTLSACETALGHEGAGDGVLGFTQAFLTSGSRAVCLSLWKVDDAATSLLMQRFYQNLLGRRPGLQQPLPKADALAEAKNWLRELPASEALKLTAEMTKGVVRGSRGKDEELKLVVPAADPKRPVKQDEKPFSHPRYWAAFILIGDPN